MMVQEKSVIEVKNLSASYSDKKIFENISFTLRPGTFTALCGQNGSGKSTLLSLIDGIIPDGLSVSGNILIDGKNIFDLKREQIAKRISYLVQKETPVWNLNVRDFIETGLYSFNEMSRLDCEKAVRSAASSLNIENLLSKNVFNISGGEFQKCRLARCLVQKSSVLLFDEPSENLDLPFQIKLLEQIKRTQKDNTVLLSIHDINTAALFADNFILFSDREIITGSYDKIFDAAVLEKAFNSKASIYFHPKFNKPQVCFLP